MGKEIKIQGGNKNYFNSLLNRNNLRSFLRNDKAIMFEFYQ